MFFWNRKHWKPNPCSHGTNPRQLWRSLPIRGGRQDLHLFTLYLLKELKRWGKKNEKNTFKKRQHVFFLLFLKKCFHNCPILFEKNKQRVCLTWAEPVRNRETSYRRPGGVPRYPRSSWFAKRKEAPRQQSTHLAHGYLGEKVLTHFRINLIWVFLDVRIKAKCSYGKSDMKEELGTLLFEAPGRAKKKHWARASIASI